MVDSSAKDLKSFTMQPTDTFLPLLVWLLDESMGKLTGRTPTKISEGPEQEPTTAYQRAEQDEQKVIRRLGKRSKRGLPPFNESSIPLLTGGFKNSPMNPFTFLRIRKRISDIESQFSFVVPKQKAFSSSTLKLSSLLLVSGNREPWVVETSPSDSLSSPHQPFPCTHHWGALSTGVDHSLYNHSASVKSASPSMMFDFPGSFRTASLRLSE